MFNISDHKKISGWGIIAASCRLLSLILFSAGPLFALDVPRLKGRVNDYASMISNRTESTLETKLKHLEQADSTQIVILTVPSLEGEVMEEFTMKVAEAWKIGQKGVDNGLLLFAAKEERRLRIEVGYGLEGRMTDLLAGRIIDNEISPQLKAGRYDEGFKQGVNAIAAAVKGEYEAKGYGSGKGGKVKLGPFFLVAFFLVAYVLDIRNRYIRGIFLAITLPMVAILFFRPISVAIFLIFIPASFVLGLILPYTDLFSTGGGRSGRHGGGGYYGSGGGSGGFGGGGFGGGGFSGGGGSFGGGGASGGW